jgi:hypothetical protein
VREDDYKNVHSTYSLSCTSSYDVDVHDHDYHSRRQTQNYINPDWCRNFTLFKSRQRSHKDLNGAKSLRQREKQERKDLNATKALDLDKKQARHISDTDADNTHRQTNPRIQIRKRAKHVLQRREERVGRGGGEIAGVGVCASVSEPHTSPPRRAARAPLVLFPQKRTRR